MIINIHTIASSSAGNCYVIEAHTGKRLMIECGLPWGKIQKALNFTTSTIDGCLVSHEHGDHAKAVKDAAKAGMDIYLSKGTAEAIGATGHRICHIKSKQQLKISGGWTVLPFDTVHDAAEPLGFLIAHGGDKLLFLTDSSYCKYLFRGITHLMIECNFDRSILDENINTGTVESSRKKRLIESHMSIDRAIKFITAIDCSKLKEVRLIHLSNDNSNEEGFKQQVQRITGVPVYVGGATIRK